MILPSTTIPMKKVPTLVLLCVSQFAFGQTARQLENLQAFNRLYGYVRYFHPSDAAANLHWEKFATYGSREVVKCNSQESLQLTLLDLFLPVAPTIQIFRTGGKVTIPLSVLTPPDTAGFKIITWQHFGLGTGNPRSVYNSGRTNKKTTLSNERNFSTITAHVDMAQYRNREFRLTGSIRLMEGPGAAQLWARIDRPDKKFGFFDNMDDRPVRSAEWKTYEIKGKVDSDASQLVFGCFLMATGKLMVDNLNLSILEGEDWKTIYSNSFESDTIDIKPKSIGGSDVEGYKTFVSGDDARDGKQSVVIQGSPVEKNFKSLFEPYCKVGEVVKKDLGSGLSAMIPLALFGNDKDTWPAGNPEKLAALQQQLKDLPVNPETDVHARTGNIIITWNVFQHFYPYFDVVKTDWNLAFPSAVKDAYANATAYDFLRTLRKLTALVKDGHVQVYNPESMAKEGFAPAIEWAWIENKLVITQVLDTNLPVKAGDVITDIDHLPAKKYFEEVNQNISAATPGWMHFRAQTASLQGPKDSKLEVTLLDEMNRKREIILSRNVNMRDYHGLVNPGDNEPVRKVQEGIYYLNISKASMEQIRNKFPELEKASALICDLRGYPKSNHEIIGHFLQENDTSKRWMRVPQIIYPDQENIAGYGEFAWNMKPQKPHLGAKVFFLLDGRAISYAESFMSFVEHYDLATIIGQPSAGTNGNVNTFNLPGNYQVSWTGMKVLKHDGSQLHGVGIFPDVYVERTIKGVRENRDEFLDKAIELANQTRLNLKD